MKLNSTRNLNSKKLTSCNLGCLFWIFVTIIEGPIHLVSIGNQTDQSIAFNGGYEMRRTENNTLNQPYLWSLTWLKNWDKNMQTVLVPFTQVVCACCIAFYPGSTFYLVSCNLFVSAQSCGLGRAQKFQLRYMPFPEKTRSAICPKDLPDLCPIAFKQANKGLITIRE